MAKRKNEHRSQASPIFVAKFADGIVTRMTTFCLPEALDLQRGIALAHTAYNTRTKKSAPMIVEAHFEMPDGGAVLQRYDGKTLEEITS